MSPWWAVDPSRAMKRVTALRWGMLAAALGLALPCALWRVELAWWPLAQAWVALAAVNLALAHPCLRGVAPERLIAAGLCADVLTLGEMLAYSGGAANPLASLFLPPVLLAALLCPPAFAWALCGTTLVLYALLFVCYLPWPLMGHDLIAGFSSHLVGMWLTFAVSAALMTAFITRLSQQLAHSAAEQREARLAQQRDEQWLALGLQAASAAHALSTPLNTLTLLVEEWQAQGGAVPGLDEDLALMQRQLELCREALLRLRQGAERDNPPVAVVAALNERILAWASLHPRVRLSWTPPAGVARQARVPEAFWSALFNVLNNAAEAGNGNVDVDACWQGEALHVDIVNHEGRLSDTERQHAGTAPLASDKCAGLGIGLMLSQAALTRLGGTLELANRAQGGVRAHLVVTLSDKGTT